MRSARPACVTARDRVAAADDGVAGAGGDGLGHGARAGRERRELERAHRAVPEDGARAGDALARRRPRSAGRCRGPSSRAGSARTAAPSTSVSAENARPATTSTGSSELAAVRRAGGARAARLGLALLVLVQRVADREAVGGREREGHRAADQDRVGALGERLEHADLVGHLDAAGDHDERLLGRVQQAAERLQLAAAAAARPPPAAGARRPRSRRARGARRRRRR